MEIPVSRIMQFPLQWKPFESSHRTCIQQAVLCPPPFLLNITPHVPLRASEIKVQVHPEATLGINACWGCVLINGYKITVASVLWLNIHILHCHSVLYLLGQLLWFPSPGPQQIISKHAYTHTKRAQPACLPTPIGFLCYRCWSIKT